MRMSKGLGAGITYILHRQLQSPMPWYVATQRA